MAPLQETLHQWQARALEKGTKQASMFAVAIPFILITSVVVILRVHVRLRLLQGRLAMDDHLILAGTFFTICLSVANMISLDIPAENLTPMLKANLATRLLYVVAICLVKFSILAFYLKLDHRKPTRYTVYFLMAFVFALSIVTFFVLLFVCVPPSLFWDPVGQALHPEKCMKQTTQQIFFNVNGIMNIVQDVMIYVLPIPIVWKLQMPRRQKIALATLLCIGLVAVAAGCVRFYYVLFLANEKDIWYYMAPSLNWCSIEIYAAIICSSASTFKALLKTYLPKIWGSYGSRGGPSGNPRHQYDQSHSGQFVMKPFGASSNKSQSNRKYGVSDLTEIGNDSEEAIVQQGTGIGTKVEISSVERQER
ncbi:hypothetical protein K458DRAFT_303568 [Lentithecium fluviatile CBS 122367]|uniref:Rhodopsin domain-containing protein n=1 Tax=Lentithecium fluviatile CBS 122367 TaxID=1168545 RepID=A0A6G1J1Y3_9PLEO|nr:hypothetical protein K458DRAFT_303568 [Lentithecium fluviatile CBS 122367]